MVFTFLRKAMLVFAVVVLLLLNSGTTFGAWAADAEASGNPIRSFFDGVFGAGTSEQVEGQLDQTAGKVQETAGEVSDNPEMEAKGEAKQAEGSIQHAIGEAEQSVEEALEG